MNTRWQREDQPLLALASAVVAPTSLIGGWTVAASLQPGRFDARHETISALAALDTPHRLADNGRLEDAFVELTTA